MLAHYEGSGRDSFSHSLTCVFERRQDYLLLFRSYFMLKTSRRLCCLCPFHRREKAIHIYQCYLCFSLLDHLQYLILERLKVIRTMHLT